MSLNNLYANIRKEIQKDSRRILPGQYSTPSDNRTIKALPQKMRKIAKTWRRAMKVKEWYPGELDKTIGGCLPARGDDAMERR
jgi:hypothetical protein